MIRISFDSVKSLIPSSVTEEISFNHDTFLEWLFFLIVDGIRKKYHSEKERGSESFFDKFVNMMIMFSFLFVLTILMLAYPLITAQDTVEIKIRYIFGILAIILLGVISWTGFVYATQDFKKVSRTKIYPLVMSYDSFVYSVFLTQFFNGFCWKWSSGRKIHFFIRSFFGILYVLSMIQMLFPKYCEPPITAFLSDFSITTFFEALVTLLPMAIMLFFIFVILMIMMTMILILLFLLIGVLILPVKIKPFIDMGDTKEYGDNVINCLYTLGIAIGLLPFLTVITQIDFPKLQIYYQISEKFHNLTLGNASSVIKNTIDQTFSYIPLDSFSKFLPFIYLYLFSVFLSLCIILVLHYHIVRRKNEEITRLEGMISYIDFVQPENFVNRDRNSYFLSLYQQLLNFHEWPVRKTFVVNLIISALLLFISRLLG